MIDWTIERPKIQLVSYRYNVDPDFLEAIRVAENGRTGLEFGVLSEPAPDYDSQLHIAVLTVAHRLTTYPVNPLWRYSFKVRYTTGFMHYFANIWAPKNSDNDPRNLNANWFEDAWKYYESRF